MTTVISCTCRPPFVHGPGFLAADFLYRSAVCADRTQGGKKLRRREADGLPMLLLIRLVTKLRGDAPVALDFDDELVADDSDTDLRATLTWLHDTRFIALNGMAGRIARLWLSPAVGCMGGTDPRIAAARHSFPYMTIAEDGMAAPQPVTVHEYSPQLWQSVYEQNQESFDSTRFLDYQCPEHGINQ
ncbi:MULTISPECIES: hypothetical protein [Streptacidiphilus]|uniref:Uncharacterized protein n=1 Tax=Streptacidiphilus cavernicola TaxID=3342716 RepID=A0ABV6UWB4_9ACTN|nr:hypothetical protein [Streptacidiphilus jeojiense]